MNKSFMNCWTVGEIEWKGDAAHITIARNKTAARQYAERSLAQAICYYEQTGKQTLEWWLKQSYNKFKTIEEMANAFIAGKYQCSESYCLRLYLRIRDGIWVRSMSNGECLHITQPSAKAMRERATIEKKSEQWADSMIKGLLATIKK